MRRVRGGPVEGECHARDSQSHPRPKISPSRLVPLPSRLLQIAEITRASPLHTPYVIQHWFVPPQPNLEHLKTSPNEYSRTRPTSLSALLAQARTAALAS